MQKLRGKCMNNLRISPLSSCKNLPPYFFHGAFAPSFTWRRRPWLVPQLGTAFRQTSGQRAATQLSRRDLKTFLFIEFYDVTDYYVFVIFCTLFYCIFVMELASCCCKKLYCQILFLLLLSELNDKIIRSRRTTGVCQLQCKQWI